MWYIPFPLYGHCEKPILKQSKVLGGGGEPLLTSRYTCECIGVRTYARPYAILKHTNIHVQRRPIKSLREQMFFFVEPAIPASKNNCLGVGPQRRTSYPRHPSDDGEQKRCAPNNPCRDFQQTNRRINKKVEYIRDGGGHPQRRRLFV